MVSKLKIDRACRNETLLFQRPTPQSTTRYACWYRRTHFTSVRTTHQYILRMINTTMRFIPHDVRSVVQKQPAEFRCLHRFVVDTVRTKQHYILIKIHTRVSISRFSNIKAVARKNNKHQVKCLTKLQSCTSISRSLMCTLRKIK